MITLTTANPLVLDTPFGGQAPAHLNAARYQANGAIALFLTSRDGIGEPLATCTVCVPEAQTAIAPDEVFIKDWSENEGMYDWLIANEIAKPTTRVLDNGYVQIPIMRLAPEIYQQIVKGLANASH